LHLENLGLEGYRVELTCSQGQLWTLPLPGPHHLEDFTAAWAVGHHFTIDPAAVQAALSSMRLSGLRLEVEKLPDGTVLLNDSYNAAPDSMKASLQVLSYAEGRKVAVLGDMLELGPTELELHHEVGQFAASMMLDTIVAVGPRSQEVARAARAAGCCSVFHFDSAEQLKPSLAELVLPGDTVLLKGSRGMHLDTLAGSIGGQREP
jgi:UDP-N-acetylmuramoyl-tripeptide--D-alanyl-D-alanine ligase